MISRDLYYRLHFLSSQEKLSAAQIGAELNLSESTVRRWLVQAEYQARCPRQVSGKLNPLEPQIAELLQRHPYTAAQIFQMLKENGYDGSYSTVKRYVAEARPPVRKAYFKLTFEPGEAAQVDFGCCGTVACDNCERRLSVFVMTLCYSRYLFAEFIPCERQEHFLTCHDHAFQHFGGVPQRTIVDNCKCAVLENHRYAPTIYNPRYLDFAAQYGFRPDACNPRSPHEKGIVENSVGYVKNNFAAGRKFGSLAEANCALRHWLDNTANIRIHKATGRSPLEMLAEEKTKFGILPSLKPDCSTVKSCRSDARCRVWFDANSYSVPSKYAQTELTLKAGTNEIFIYHDVNSIASHRRSYGRKVDIVDLDHSLELRQMRTKARLQNLRHDFLKIHPVAEAFLAQMELRELEVDSQLRKIITLTEMHGQSRVAEIMRDMLEFKVFKAEYVEHRLRCGFAEKNSPPSKLHVPKAEDLMNIELPMPNLNVYDKNGDK